MFAVEYFLLISGELRVTLCSKHKGLFIWLVAWRISVVWWSLFSGPAEGLVLLWLNPNLLNPKHALHWAIPLETHTPCVEYLQQIFHRGSVTSKWIDRLSYFIWNSHPLCTTLWFNVSQRVNKVELAALHWIVKKVIKFIYYTATRQRDMCPENLLFHWNKPCTFTKLFVWRYFRGCTHFIWK